MTDQTTTTAEEQQPAGPATYEPSNMKKVRAIIRKEAAAGKSDFFFTQGNQHAQVTIDGEQIQLIIGDGQPTAVTDKKALYGAIKEYFSLA